MQSNKLKETFVWMNRLEIPFCVLVNRSVKRTWLKVFFAKISRLGDGVFWYFLMLAMPIIYGAEGLLVSVEMVFVGAVGLVVYRRIKTVTSRPRPFESHKGIQNGTLPLDKFSFPSGHTLHAVSFAWILFFFEPMLGWIVWPFAFLVAISRMVLGLHYPSDVLVGGLTGILLAELTLAIF